ncbi:MAG TPA: phosphate/phosphite/phosphonate ABC transporter substrate-binding protein [Methylomirabilota bacterium]|nr:phosphate/phosphite/phosphonate ABC transporter substrate-binding protein [Methylomirabilota bacterium]
MRARTLTALVLVAMAWAAIALAADPCRHRGHLDAMYCDDNSDGIADPPKDPARLVSPDPLVFAYVPVEDPAVYTTTFADLMRHIEKATGKKVQFFGPQNYAAQLEAMRSGRLHITGYSTGSLPYAVNLSGAVPFAQMATDKGPSGYHLIVMAKADNARINSLADLKGKRVAHVSQTSNSGHQAPVYFFSKLGVAPGKDYQIAFSGKHDNSVLGVVNGDYEAAAVADTVLERMVNRGLVKKSDYKVIYTSPVFPRAGWAYHHALEPGLAAKIKDAFYGFRVQGSSVGKEFRDITRFVSIDYKKDWESVVGILEANGASFSRESGDYKKLSEPPRKGGE